MFTDRSRGARTILDSFVFDGLVPTRLTRHAFFMAVEENLRLQEKGMSKRDGPSAGKRFGSVQAGDESDRPAYR